MCARSMQSISNGLHYIEMLWKFLLDSLRINNSHIERGCWRTAREFLQWGIMRKPWQKQFSFGIQLATWCAEELPCTKLWYLGNVCTFYYRFLWAYLHTTKKELREKKKYWTHVNWKICSSFFFSVQLAFVLGYVVLNIYFDFIAICRIWVFSERHRDCLHKTLFFAASLDLLLKDLL